MPKTNLSTNIKPVVKWVGGKQRLIKNILPLIPSHSTYVEPFLGGGSLFFKLQPSKAIIGDRSKVKELLIYNF